MKSMWIKAGLISLVGIAAGCGDTEETAIVSENQALTWEEFRSVIYQEPETGVYIVNGDEPIETDRGLRDFYNLHVQAGALIVNTVSGRDDAWDADTAMNLTYCVSRSSFGANYDRVVQAMDEATGAWEAVGAIDFVHVAALDDNCSQRTGGVVFDVRQVASGQYLARAFFPSTSRRNRNVLIDTSTYFYDNDPSDPLSLVGVLRHELGHALGFRHEHTRPESGTCFEDNSWRALTAYDSDSVMHYPQCNGTGDWSLQLTARDAQGAADLYSGDGGGAGGSGGEGGAGGGGGECLPKGDACESSADCCSLNCGPKRGQFVCK